MKNCKNTRSTTQNISRYRTEDAPEVAERPDFVDIVLDDADLTAGTVAVLVGVSGLLRVCWNCFGSVWGVFFVFWHVWIVFNFW